MNKPNEKGCIETRERQNHVLARAPWRNRPRIWSCLLSETICSW